MNNTDTRVQYTKHRFHEALIELLEQKPVLQITVSELCQKAGLNRGTFYLHYKDPLDILHEMEVILTEDIDDFVGTVLAPDAFEAVMIKQLERLHENRRFAAALLGRNGDPSFLGAYRQQYIARIDALSLSAEEREKEKLRFDYLLSGCTGVVVAWLQGDYQGTAEQMAKRIVRIQESVLNTEL